MVEKTESWIKIHFADIKKENSKGLSISLQEEEEEEEEVKQLRRGRKVFNHPADKQLGTREEEKRRERRKSNNNKKLQLTCKLQTHLHQKKKKLRG